MARYTEIDGVYFTEDNIELVVLGQIEAVAPTQNSTLVDVKRTLAQKAKDLGGNGVIGFVYGQKADSPLRHAFGFKWDSERMRASGKVVRFETDPRS
jgi:hypothetical protein